MQAAVRDRYGGPEVVRVEEIPTPVPRAGEILVRVHAASVNRGDLDQVQPRPSILRLFLGLRGPRNLRLGTDVAGVVEEVGPDVTRFRPGDRVFADLFAFGQGSFAEFVAAPEKAFLPIPDGIDFDVASTLPHSAILALQGLRTRGGRTVQPGSKVLIDGASGNVGPFAVQIAKWLGAEVTGVCRTGKVDFVRSLGADHVIDYTKVDFTRAAERYDWILAADSHHALLRVRRVLRPGGRYATLGGGSLDLLAGTVLGPLTALAGSRRAGLMLWWKPFHPPDVATLTELVLAGHLKPVIDRRYRLADVGEALRVVDEGVSRGKVVITPTNEPTEAASPARYP
jgi:NADPH:quinone reductase-like Zn-dependent oxidoreductase